MTAPSLRAALLALLLTLASQADEPRRLPPVDGAAPSVTPYPVVTAAYQPLIGAAWDDGPPVQPRFEVGALFDKGFFIRATDLERDPYAMYIGARLQLRHTGFARDASTWTDSAGVTRQIRNRNNFDTERLRLNISGTAVDPNLTYYAIFDGDADGGSNVDQLAYIFTYAFDDALKVRVGRWKVASDREWLMSSRHLLLVDRSMATEFFRVGFSDGVWLLGDFGPNDAWHYETSLTNGQRTSTRPPFSLDDNLGAAATIHWDPLGPFGPGFADYACHCDPVIRIGASVAFDRSTDRADAGAPLGDDGFLRLSDGTRLADVGALAPGVRVLSDRVLGGSIDAGLKWNGWSLNGEYFVRSIHDLTADGVIPVTQIDDHGFRVEAGVFLVPKRFELLARMSQVTGDRNTAQEYAAGFNYYWGNGTRDGKLVDRVNKFSMDVTSLDGNPVTSTPADLVAGDDGVLFRTQVQIGF